MQISFVGKSTLTFLGKNASWSTIHPFIGELPPQSGEYWVVTPIKRTALDLN